MWTSYHRLCDASPGFLNIDIYLHGNETHDFHFHFKNILRIFVKWMNIWTSCLSVEFGSPD